MKRIVCLVLIALISAVCLVGVAGCGGDGYEKVQSVKYGNTTHSSYYVVLYEQDKSGTGTMSTRTHSSDIGNDGVVPEYKKGEEYYTFYSGELPYINPMIILDFRVLYVWVKVINPDTINIRYSTYLTYDGELHIKEHNITVSGESYIITRFN